MKVKALLALPIFAAASFGAANAAGAAGPGATPQSSTVVAFDLSKMETVLPGRHVAEHVPKLPDNLFSLGGGQMNGRSRDLQSEFAVQMNGLKATAVYWAPVVGMTRKRYEDVKDEKGQVIRNADGSPKRSLRETSVPVEEQPTHMVVINGYVLRVGSFLPRALIKGDGKVQVVEISMSHVRLAGEMQSVGFDGRPTKIPAFTNIPVDAHEVFPEE